MDIVSWLTVYLNRKKIVYLTNITVKNERTMARDDTNLIIPVPFVVRTIEVALNIWLADSWEGPIDRIL